jgi:hypothetical protein
MTTRGADGGAKSRPTVTFKQLMAMLPFPHDVQSRPDYAMGENIGDFILSQLMEEAIPAWIRGAEYVVVDDLPLEETPENEYRRICEAIIAHPFFENMEVTYTISEPEHYPDSDSDTDSPSGQHATFTLRWG